MQARVGEPIKWIYSAQTVTDLRYDIIRVYFMRSYSGRLTPHISFCTENKTRSSDLQWAEGCNAADGGGRRVRALINAERHFLLPQIYHLSGPR